MLQQKVMVVDEWHNNGTQDNFGEAFYCGQPVAHLCDNLISILKCHTHEVDGLYQNTVTNAAFDKFVSDIWEK